MRDDCLEVLAKLDKCMEDPDFQIIIVMKFLRSISPYFQVTNDDRSRINLRSPLHD